MGYVSFSGRRIGVAGLLAALAIFILLGAAPQLRAADNGSDDYDQYKIRFDAFWFHSEPSGNFQGSGENDVIDVQKDLGFNSYSTFSGFIDWKFTRKNHFTFSVSPFQQSRRWY